MKFLTAFFLAATAFVGTAQAIIYVPPIEERVAGAESIFVGVITLDKTEGGWHYGTITADRVIKGGVESGAKIPVRWKAPAPKPADPALPQLADYTYRPTLGEPQIILLNPKAEGDERYQLNWGNTEPPGSEPAVTAALNAPPAPDPK